MRTPKPTKLKMTVTTCKRHVDPVQTTVEVLIPDHQTAVAWSEAVGRKLKEFSSQIQQSIQQQ